MTTLEAKLGGSAYAPTADASEQSKHATAPSQYAVGSQGLQVVIVVGVFMAAIYGLHIAGRVMKRGRD